MKPHTVVIGWDRNENVFVNQKYSRAHIWQFDGGAKVRASSSPDIVKVPFSDTEAVDPEEAFVASLASCHMLWFLDVCARGGYVVDNYADRAEGYLTARDDGRLWISRVLLMPKIQFSGDIAPTGEIVQDLHHRAHQECFLANTVKTEILIQGSWFYELPTAALLKSRRAG